MMLSRASTVLLRQGARPGAALRNPFSNDGSWNCRTTTTGSSSSSSSGVPAIASSARTMPSSSLLVGSTGRRFFAESADSHDDFAPRRKVVDGMDEAMQVIQEHVQSNRVMLYMKGNPSMPMCGFSAKVVQILQTEGVDFSSVNVLDYPDIREGVKKFSEWPTIPQLYVDGEFIGGCDIITQMHEAGELREVLAEVKEE